MSSEMLNEVQTFHQEMKSRAVGEAPEESPALPPGADPVVEEVEDKTEKIEAPAEAPAAPVEEPPKKDEPETLIRIGAQTFKTQAEAVRYAEQLEREKELAEAREQGIRDALSVTQPQVTQAPVEDKFEEEFYSNPKATLQKVKEQAKEEIRAETRALQTQETLWRQFGEKFPDIDRRDAERVMTENTEIFSKMTNIDKGMELLAQKTRAEYQRIMERMKPRTELHQSKGTSTIPSSSRPQSVTPKKSDEQVLTLAQQMSMLRGKRR